MLVIFFTTFNRSGILNWGVNFYTNLRTPIELF
jgi:hypothetical protein